MEALQKRQNLPPFALISATASSVPLRIHSPAVAPLPVSGSTAPNP